MISPSEKVEKKTKKIKSKENHSDVKVYVCLCVVVVVVRGYLIFIPFKSVAIKSIPLEHSSFF